MWVLLAILAVALVVAIVLLATRRGRGPAVMPEAERRRRLDMAVSSWAAQGWALESETTDSAVLRVAGERMLVSVDPNGQISARPLSPGAP